MTQLHDCVAVKFQDTTTYTRCCQVQLPVVLEGRLLVEFRAISCQDGRPYGSLVGNT